MKHLRNIILIIAMSILSDASSFAQTTYTLSQCIDYALCWVYMLFPVGDVNAYACHALYIGANVILSQSSVSI